MKCLVSPVTHLRPGLICVLLFVGVQPYSGPAHAQREVVRRSPRQNLVLAGARRQLSKPAIYTVGYFKLRYPGGDLPPDKGVCTDVVIRALRHAGLDLQKLIHEDMKRRFATYPRRERSTDANIDHRRVPNQIHWLKKYAKTLPLESDWQAGDLIFWKLPGGLDHCGVISDRQNAKGQPLVIHNIWQTAEEDVFSKWRVVTHFRISPPEARR